MSWYNERHERVVQVRIDPSCACILGLDVVAELFMCAEYVKSHKANVKTCWLSMGKLRAKPPHWKWSNGHMSLGRALFQASWGAVLPVFHCEFMPTWKD